MPSDKRKVGRKDTSIEAVGAEHLVMGHLMREGIQTYMADQRQRGYDLICVNPDKRKVKLVQVKSRWATDNDGGFPMKDTGSDFVVVAFLNCGDSFGGENGKQPPEFFVIPTKECLKVRMPGNWNKVFLRRIPNVEKYRDNWKQIKRALKIDSESL